MLIFSRYLRLLRLQTRNIAFSCSAEKHSKCYSRKPCICLIISQPLPHLSAAPQPPCKPDLPAHLIPDTKPDQTPVNVTLLQYIDVEVKIYDLNGTLVFEK